MSLLRATGECLGGSEGLGDTDLGAMMDLLIAGQNMANFRDKWHVAS